MHLLNRFLVAAGIFSFTLATFGNAAERTTISPSKTPVQSRDAAKSRTELVGFSTTTDVDIWLNQGGSIDTSHLQVTVNFANQGLHYSYSRDYFLVFSAPGHTWIILDQETGVLAPNASGQKSFLVPKVLIGMGAVVEVGLFGSDDDPSNDYHKITLPQNRGI
ncbi:MAG: hypothetical protein WBD20_13675 [Pirellulaceae bacterium]